MVTTRTKEKLCIPVVRIGGTPYFHLTKSDSTLRQILRGDNEGNVMPRTDIIERIGKAKDDKYKQLMVELGANLKSSGPNRYTAKNNLSKSLSLPEVVSISVDGVDGVPGITMNVLCSKPSKTRLMVELNNANLEFIARVVEAQVADGKIHRKHKRALVDAPENIGEKGISTVYGREDDGAYRAVVQVGEKKVNRFEKWSVNGKNEAKCRILDWLMRKKAEVVEEITDAM
jgi:hypothetical protein